MASASSSLAFNLGSFRKKNFLSSDDLNIKNLNNLNLRKIEYDRYPMVKILKLLTNSGSLYETVLVSANDKLVDLFLNKIISFNSIHKELFKIMSLKEFKKLKKIYPKNIQDILKLNDYVRLKISKKVYKS